MADFFRYGWPRWYIVRVCGWIPDGKLHDAILDFLYPDDMEISFAANSPHKCEDGNG